MKAGEKFDIPYIAYGGHYSGELFVSKICFKDNPEIAYELESDRWWSYGWWWWHKY